MAQLMSSCTAKDADPSSACESSRSGGDRHLHDDREAAPARALGTWRSGPQALHASLGPDPQRITAPALSVAAVTPNPRVGDDAENETASRAGQSSPASTFARPPSHQIVVQV